ncbi:hypothetical protein LCGC14_0475780 [marine sediment metagenome]|uniref:Uncharacterized protein n=1 Tax=marine sediment metagenome TaxID=412755 RepID=A0A0F9UXQ2_9ZZZZ
MTFSSIYTTKGGVWYVACEMECNNGCVGNGSVGYGMG